MVFSHIMNSPPVVRVRSLEKVKVRPFVWPLVLGAVLMLTSASPTRGQDKPADSQSRFRTYLAMEYIYQDFPDDFDGFSFYSDGINLYTVPTLSAGNGFRVSLGFREPRFGFEVSYQTSSHTTDWLGIPGKARHHEVGADAKRYLFPGGWVQPYGKVGLLLHFLVLDEGAIDLETDSLDTVREMYGGGIGLRLAGGLRVNITGTLGLRGEAEFRVGRFRTLAGRTINTLSASNLVFSAGMVYTFKR